MQKTPDGFEQLQIGGDGFADAGLHHLDDHLIAAWGLGQVHLRNRRRADGRLLKMVEEILQRQPQALLDDLPDLVERDRREAVEEVLQFVGDHRRQQVFADRHDLPQLDERRPEHFEPPPKLDGKRQLDQIPLDKRPEQEPHQARPRRPQPAPAFRRQRPRISYRPAHQQPDDVPVGDKETPHRALVRLQRVEDERRQLLNGHPLLRRSIDVLSQHFQHRHLLRHPALVRRAVGIDRGIGRGRRCCF